MEQNPNIQKLKDARALIAQVYEDEVNDELHDNGNLTILNNAVLNIAKALETIEGRQKEL